MGSVFNIVPEIDDTPDDGAIRLAFGDPSKYIIAIDGPMTFQVNPYVSMKEGITQFIGYMMADGNMEDVGAWHVLKRAD
jgi:hypothetical protein